MGKKVVGIPYKAVLESAIGMVLDKLKGTGELTLKIRPEFRVYSKKEGEWITDVACLLGRSEGKDKAELAQLIIDSLPWNQGEICVTSPFEEFKVHAPGFIVCCTDSNLEATS